MEQTDLCIIYVPALQVIYNISSEQWTDLALCMSKTWDMMQLFWQFTTDMPTLKADMYKIIYNWIFNETLHNRKV